MSKQSSVAGIAQICRIFFLRLNIPCSLRVFALQRNFDMGCLGGEQSAQFCSSFRGWVKYFWIVRRQIDSVESRLKSRHRSNRRDSVIAINASRSRRRRRV